MIESVLEPLFHKTSIKKHWTFAEVGTNFAIHENNISFESLNYYLSICDSDRLVFGRCASARLTLEFLNINLALIGRNFDVDFTFEDEPEIPFVVGNFTVTEDKPSPDRKTRSVTMYDALYFVLNTNYADWYNAITDSQWESMTLGGLADSFFAHVGITVESASRAALVNADMPVSKTLATEQLLGSDILFAICQAAGCFGVMTNNNEFRFLYLKSEIEGLFPANDLYPADDLYPVEPVTTYIPTTEYYPPLVYETYMTPSITKLRIAESTEDVGTTIGSGDVGYEIVGNFLFFGKTAQQLNTYGANTLGAMTQRNYRPYSVEKLGNLCFEIGDPIRLGNEDMSVESYMLTRTFKGVQAFTDEISAEGTQDYITVASSISATVDKLQSKTLILKKDIDEVSATMTYQLDPTAGEPGGTHNSYAYQTAQQIGAKVETTTYNNFVNNTYATFVSQTDSALTAKAEKTVGNFTTGFSCTLDTTGHTWYKDNQQVMKIDGSGLTVTGKVVGSEFICGNESTPTARIKSSGDYMIIGGSLALFDAEHSGQYTISFNTDDFEMSTSDEIDMMIYDAQALYATSNYISEDDSYETRVCLGCDDDGHYQANKVAINGSDWVHVGVSSPSIHIGGTGNNGSTDIRIQAQSDSDIVFKYGTTSVTTKTLASILSDVSNAVSTAGSAYDRAGLAQSAAGTAQTTANSAVNTHNTVTVPALQDHGARILALEQEARSHGWNI